MRRDPCLLIAIFLVCAVPVCRADTPANEADKQETTQTVGEEAGKVDLNKVDKSPSMEKVRWTEAKISSDLNTEYDFVGGPLNEHYTDVRFTTTRRTLLAFLLHTGFEYQRTGFDGRRDLLLPGQLATVNAYLALDARWSKKDLLRIQSRPGFYSDFENFDINEFNAPVDVAYTRVQSDRFQWAFGISIDTWRSFRVLPGGGIRYQINDRWKIKGMLPEPQIEYKARDDLHVFFGMDFRGDTYRVAKDFGTAHGNPAFDKALVDYSEIRVGPGFSWNIKPLIEFNVQAGTLLQRSFDYHNNGLTIHEGGMAPFIAFQLHCLFKLRPPEKLGPEIESGRFEVRQLHSLLQFL